MQRRDLVVCSMLEMSSAGMAHAGVVATSCQLQSASDHKSPAPDHPPLPSARHLLPFRAPMSLAVRLETASADFQKLQLELSTVVEARQRLDAQLNENELVKKEFAQLTPDNVVFKQIGPALVKQDQAEAKSNVNTRLDFIKGEIKRVEGQLKDIEQKTERKKAEIIDIQTAIQQQQAQAPAS